MTRAAVLIGVNRTGGLPVLADAVNGAKRMEAWALAQGMARKRVLLFTDEHGPVDVGDVYHAVRTLIESGTVEQLIVYFAGHGVNIRYGEYWLLSEAPIDASAAVNVEGSIVLARRSGIPHVVFISDACRTAAEGIQAQGITGREIFPNDPVPGPENPVDLFFGTTLGRPALEIKDPDTSTAAFKALYTGAVLDAFSGRLPAAAVLAEVGGDLQYLVRPRRLKTCLVQELPQRLAGLGVPATVSQVPDARITSDDDAWLASFKELVAQPGSARGGLLGGRPATPVTTTLSRAQAQLGALLDVDRPAVLGANPPWAGIASRGGFVSPGRRRGAAESGPTHFETGCGFKLVGAGIAEAVSPDADIEVLGDDRMLARIGFAGPAANVLLILGDGSGILLPAVKGFLAALAIEDGELADVAYEPSDNTSRWQDFAGRADELRTLRAVVAGAAREGVFRLEGKQAPALARRMQYARQIDPALALYAAYAYHGLQQTERIREMNVALELELGFSFFDLEMLSGVLAPRAGAAVAHYPPVPMLAQGWALLRALGVALPDELQALQRHLLPSLWTHFNPEGASRLRELVSSRRLK